MKLKNRWMKYFFGLEPAPAVVVMPAMVVFICTLLFTDKASIKRLRSYASDYGKRIRKIERQIPDFAEKESIKPIIFEFSFYEEKEGQPAESEGTSSPSSQISPNQAAISSFRIDDIEVDLESMSDEEYQEWIIQQVPENDRPRLVEFYERQNAFRESLIPAQLQVLEFEVATTYAQMVSMAGGADKLSGSQKSAMRRAAESAAIMQYGMREAAEQQQAELREMFKQRREVQLRDRQESQAEEDWRMNEALRQLEEAAGQ